MSAVVPICACPRIRLTSNSGVPSVRSRVAAVCLSVWNFTKSSPGGLQRRRQHVANRAWVKHHSLGGREHQVVGTPLPIGAGAHPLLDLCLPPGLQGLNGQHG